MEEFQYFFKTIRCNPRVITNKSSSKRENPFACCGYFKSLIAEGTLSFFHYHLSCVSPPHWPPGISPPNSQPHLPQTSVRRVGPTDTPLSPHLPKLVSGQWVPQRHHFSPARRATSARMVQAWSHASGPTLALVRRIRLAWDPMSGPRREGQSTTTPSSSSPRRLPRMNRTLIQTLLLISGIGWCTVRPHQTTPPVANEWPKTHQTSSSPPRAHMSALFTT